MNYFKEAEKNLSNRKNLGKALRNLYKRQNRLLSSGAPKPPTAIDPAKPYVSGGMVNDTMTDCLDLVEVQKEIAITKAKIKEIDDVIKQLPEESKKILSLWYIEEKDKDDMCEIFHCATRQTLYDKRNKAIGEFAVLSFGAPALYAI